MRSHPTMIVAQLRTLVGKVYVIEKYPYNMLGAASSGLLAGVAGEALS